MKYTRISSIIVTLLLLLPLLPIANVNAMNDIEFLKLSNDLYVMNEHILRYFTEPTPVLGEQNILVIFVEFTDVKHSVSMDSILDRLLDVRRYYVEVSYGQMIPIWISYDWSDNAWLTLPHDKAYYGAPSGSSPDARWYELVVDSIKAADPYVDYRYYKRVLVFHAGGDEAFTGNPYDIWSFAVMDLSISTDDGEVELNIAVASENDPIGVIAHELGHTFYLPDLYDYSGQTEFVGRWCLMAIGAWNGAPYGSSPAELCSWCRLKLGWIPDQGVIDVKTNTIMNITLLALETPVGYKVARIRIDDKHYYLIEVRVRKSFDQYLPGEGVLILYVDETKGSGEGIVRVIDSTPGDGDVDNGEWSTGMIYRNNSLMLTIRIGNRVGEEYSIATSYKTHKEITILPTIVEAGGKITIHVEYDEAINHVIVFLEDKWLTTVYPETQTNTMNITIPIPSVNPGTYKLKVKAIGETSTYTEVFTISIIKRIEPKIHVFGPTKLKPETTAKYITYIEVNGQSYDPDKVKAYLINDNGEVITEALIEKVGKGIYLITINVPKIESKEAYYTLKVEAISNKTYIFSTTIGYPIYVGISLSDIDTTLSKLNTSLTELTGYLEEIQGNVMYIKTGIGVIEASLENINARLIGIENGVALINSSIGIIKANLSAINAKIESVENGIVSITTSLGEIKATLKDINAEIVRVENGIVLLRTDLGFIKANLTLINAQIIGIENKIVLINSSIGIIRVKLSELTKAIGTIVAKVEENSILVKTVIGELKLKLDDIDSKIIEIRKNMLVLNTSIGLLEVKVSELGNIMNVTIRNGVALLKTDLGTLKADLSTLNAKIVKVEGNVVVLSSAIGEIRTSLSSINAKLEKIEGNVASIYTDLGLLKGELKEVVNGTAIVRTSIGELKIKIPKQLEELQNINMNQASKIQEIMKSIENQQTLNYTIIGLLVITVIISSISMVKKK